MQKNQRPELFNNFNNKINIGESMRIFPLSNWNEIDIWEYIRQENIEIVPLYFAKKRPIVTKNGAKIMVDDERIKFDNVSDEMVRFRTLGCYPLTGAVSSDAKDLDEIIDELKKSRYSERQGRIIDSDQNASMERKKREGYF